jgi:hypothetical protein
MFTAELLFHESQYNCDWTLQVDSQQYRLTDIIIPIFSCFSRRYKSVRRRPSKIRRTTDADVSEVPFVMQSGLVAAAGI